ncbi:ubiquitin domain-containing protein/BAG domain-containing protein [Cephalotus follicularis]|uniref:Ubiquitin domain-containing protein/BAG domain-containing protein n=1 Tax=Cephalotus follicularis TaxID=3775 RepID=A0A1Q3C036_CEPFO|nr:ubiquitin domain-containing protein/BAG domain-containing protein [Cephalotus follicularis]
MNEISNSNEQVDWEMRPGGMLVQRRDEENNHNHDSSGGSLIMINVSHGSTQYEVYLPPQSTFGDLKEAVAKETGLAPKEQKILFRGKENEDNENLHTSGVKDKSKVFVLENPKIQEVKTEDLEPSEEMLKALEKISGVRSEVDKLSERVSALKVDMDGGTKVANEEFDVSTELLMRELLKLDGIEAEGNARMQRKAEVRRIQEFQETLDNLKARNCNPSSNRTNGMSVTTNWESFESGMGSLSPPSPMPSSTKVTQDWEQFD